MNRGNVQLNKHLLTEFTLAFKDAFSNCPPAHSQSKWLWSCIHTNFDSNTHTILNKTHIYLPWYTMKNRFTQTPISHYANESPQALASSAEMKEKNDIRLRVKEQNKNHMRARTLQAELGPKFNYPTFRI